MRLAVFDIDGTLTDTCDVDVECFGAAVDAVFGVPASVVDGEWRSYPHITDSGIARTLVERHLSRELATRELARLEAVFVELLTAAIDRDPERCRPLPGAVEFIAHLAASGDWEVALATGGFRRSALLKLCRAGFDPPPFLATSGEAMARADIVQAAIRTAAEGAGTDFHSVVLLGDGPWDVTTGLDLKLPCVAIASGETAGELLAAGAVAVLGDYVDRENACRVLTAAAEGSVQIGTAPRRGD